MEAEAIEEQPARRSNYRGVAIAGFVLTLLAAVPSVIASVESARNGTLGDTGCSWTLPCGVFFCGLTIAILLCPLLFFEKTAESTSHLWAFAGGSLVAVILAMELNSHIYRGGREGVIERATPIVKAVEQYQRDHGTPPGSLELLQPDYLAEWPERIPEFEYWVHGDGTWSLRAYCGKMMTNHRLVYAPHDFFPESRYTVTRIGDWAVINDR